MSTFDEKKAGYPASTPVTMTLTAEQVVIVGEAASRLGLLGLVNEADAKVLLAGLHAMIEPLAALGNNPERKAEYEAMRAKHVAHGTLAPTTQH